MQIYGPFRLTTSQATSVQGAKAAGNASAAGKSDRLAGADATARTSASPVDQLDLSSAVTGANRLESASPVAGGGEIRIDRVAELRRQIASGNYETPEKLDAALDRFLDDFA